MASRARRLAPKLAPALAPALVVGAALILLMTACAAGPNPALNVPASNGDVAGFWLGLWHGIISPITFIISLFTKDVTLYEVHNDGNWYNFGFVLGAGILFSGGFLGARSGGSRSRAR
jgi:hypothetical protein